MGSVAVGSWLAAMLVAAAVDRAPGRSELVRSMDSVAWPVARSSPLVPQSPPAAAVPPSPGGSQIASVQSMIGGLEARLAAQPDDAGGWALLAQSYAYTADREATERAIRRAVELGVDEQALRDRVAGARQSAHPNGPPSIESR